MNEVEKKCFRVVLTGGPCGGKTTGQSLLCSFFENLGWKVYRVPETATILQGGGVKFSTLNEEEMFKFQENLMKTMQSIEDTYFELASTCKTNCLVICDRGQMDATAYMSPEQWARMKLENGWNEVDLRDRRYHQVIHMMSSAKGAQFYYQLENNSTRTEDLENAQKLDDITAQAWVGHPYFDVIDNSTSFDRKVMRMIAVLCNRIGLESGDRLAENSKKRKFLVSNIKSEFDSIKSQDFVVIHDYLVTPGIANQARIRRRGQNVKWDSVNNCWNVDTGNWTFTHTLRKEIVNNEKVELRTQISEREYKLLLAQKSNSHFTIYKKRQCFLWNNCYFQLDIYEHPCHPRCENLVILETYTEINEGRIPLPPFLDILDEVTKVNKYSMFNLSLKDDDTSGCNARH